MKKQFKLLAGILSIFMLITAIPFGAMATTNEATEASNAKQPLKTTTDLSTLTHLIHTDHIGTAATNTVDGTTVTYTPEYHSTWTESTIYGSAYCDTSDPSKLYATRHAEPTETGRGGTATTNLPLNENAQYVITFTAQVHVDYSAAGFIFSSATHKNNNKIIRNNNTWRMGTMGYDNGYVPEPYVNYPDYDLKNEANYVMSIDGMKVTLYRDGVKLYSGTVGSYVSSNLIFGVYIRSVAMEGDLLATISNIDIYQGKYEVQENYTEGDVLLRMATLGGENTSDFSGVTLTNAKSRGAEITNGTLTVTDASSEEKWLFDGFVTNLELNESSKYTVEFYLKPDYSTIGNVNLHFTFAGNNHHLAQGFGITSGKIITSSINETKDAYGVINNNVGDGGTVPMSLFNWNRFLLEINGYVITVYLQGQSGKINKLGEMNLANGGTNPTAYTTPSLAFGLKTCGGTDHYVTDRAIVSVKDLTVYAGNVAENAIYFEDENGNPISAGAAYAPGDVIDSFPEVTPTTEGNLIKWFYKGTNVMVNAPYTVTHDATIVAREIDPATTAVAAAQCTTIDTNTNTQDVRFIATLHTLQATDVGFRVIAEYGVDQKKEWNVSSTVVYSAIIATTNNTVQSVTAEELGGTYLVALAVEDVPTTVGDIIFKVNSYITVNGEKVPGDVVEFKLSGGKLTSVTE